MVCKPSLAHSYCVYLFGTFRIEQKLRPISLPTQKIRSLFAYLILHPGLQSREKLATLFWGDSSDEKAHGSLRKALTLLRTTITKDILLADRENVQLNPAVSLWVDVFEFERQARQLLADPSPDLSCIDLDLYQGDLLLDPYDDWILPLREHYRVLYMDVLLHVVESLRAKSEYGTAIEYAQRALACDATNERAHQHRCSATLSWGIAARPCNNTMPVNVLCRWSWEWSRRVRRGRCMTGSDNRLQTFLHWRRR